MRNYQRRKEQRPPPPKGWRFTERDQDIVLTIPYYEGFISVPQVQDLFFNNTTGGKRKAHKRLEIMWKARLLNRQLRWEQANIPETYYYLAKQGTEFVQEEGVPYALEDDIFHWVKRPNTSKIRHDLMINEFHLDVDLACRNSEVSVLKWRPSYMFKVKAGGCDEVEYIDHRGRHARKRYEPDSYFMLGHHDRELRFMLEIDRAREGKEQNYRVFREKILLGVPYIDSKAYEQRFGLRSGRMLIVTAWEGRIERLLDKTIQTFGNMAQWYLFTTFDQVSPETVIHAPIWFKYNPKTQSVGKVSLLTG